MAGLYFAFSTAVMPALGGSSAGTGDCGNAEDQRRNPQSIIPFPIFWDRCRIRHIRSHFASHLAGATRVVAAHRRLFLPSRQFPGDNPVQRPAQQGLGKRSSREP
jgi:hypothetical protein